MSRISKNPVIIPQNVEVLLNVESITIKGPLGQLIQKTTSDTIIESVRNTLIVSAANESKHSNAMSGTIRSLIANMVEGVSIGFVKKLTLIGVGYRAQVAGDNLNLSLGFSHPISYKMPEGVFVESPVQTEIILKGIDKQKVGQVAAEIRAFRKPEPYKGKGVRYADEVIILKEAKKK
ncbi:MAG: 50S ribosomal protein L6 [Nitrosomonas sp.]|nr:50S ribosomal protein L6 [Nitrosomonas sp.]MDP1951352.1 50S ribosomal protein L6 [Nitrosomonas sp.]